MARWAHAGQPPPLPNSMGSALQNVQAAKWVYCRVSSGLQCVLCGPQCDRGHASGDCQQPGWCLVEVVLLRTADKANVSKSRSAG